MQGGDISNEVPKRIAVTLDCVVDKTVTTKKLFKLIPVEDVAVHYNRVALSKFWDFSYKMGVVLELVTFGMFQKEADEVLEDLNNLGTNPFSYVKAYDAVSVLVSEMPYRPELLGVVDIPERALRYGSKYVDIWRAI